MAIFEFFFFFVSLETGTRTPIQQASQLEESSDEDDDDDNEGDFSPPAHYRSGGGGGGGLGDGSKHGSEPRSSSVSAMLTPAAEPADANMALLKAEFTGGAVRNLGILGVWKENGGAGSGAGAGPVVTADLLLQQSRSVVC